MTSALEVLVKFRDNLLALGTRRLVALGLTALTVFTLVGVSGYLLSRPQQEVLYSGLDPQDVPGRFADYTDAFDLVRLRPVPAARPVESAPLVPSGALPGWDGVEPIRAAGGRA